MSTEKWIAGSGVGVTWTNAFTGTTLNSIANGNAIASDLIIDNTTALDVFCAVSIHLASAAFVAPNFIGVYIYPLNAGAPGTIYGDGRFGSSAAGPPPDNYRVGNIGIVAATQAQDGILLNIQLPIVKCKFVLYNQGGVAFAATLNTCQYITYNRAVV